MRMTLHKRRAHVPMTVTLLAAVWSISTAHLTGEKCEVMNVMDLPDEVDFTKMHGLSSKAARSGNNDFNMTIGHRVGALTTKLQNKSDFSLRLPCSIVKHGGRLRYPSTF